MWLLWDRKCEYRIFLTICARKFGPNHSASPRDLERIFWHSWWGKSRTHISSSQYFHIPLVESRGMWLGGDAMSSSNINRSCQKCESDFLCGIFYFCWIMMSSGINFGINFKKGWLVSSQWHCARCNSLKKKDTKFKEVGLFNQRQLQNWQLWF